MKRFALLWLVCTAPLLGGVAAADCPEGRSPILIITPSGKETTLCIPDESVPGLENAEENSPGTVAPNPCPCFGSADVQSMIDNPIGIVECDASVAGAICFDYSPGTNELFRLMAAAPCTDDPTVKCGLKLQAPTGETLLLTNQCITATTDSFTVTGGTYEQQLACVSVIEPFVP